MEYRKGLVVAMISAGIVLLAGIANAAVELEEIFVTATKREAVVQDAPMSIIAISGDSISDQGILDLDQLSASVPNFQVGDGTLTTNISMRGMGSQPERGFEQSVGMFIDGLYMPRSRQYRAPFMDASRVEILRGPQAVLFGLNSTAGAISIISNTSRPSDATTAELTAAYEMEYEGTMLQGVFGGPVNDTLGLRLAARYRNESEGTYFNSFTGSTENASKETVLRATAAFEPGEATSLTLKIDYADFGYVGDFGEEFGQPYVLDAFGLSNGNTERSLDFHRNMDSAGADILAGITGGRSSAGMNQENLTAGLTLDQQIGEHSLTVILGYSDLEWDNVQDFDFGPALIMTGAIAEEYRQSSIELRLSSPIGQTLEWIVGGYYQDDELVNQQPNILGSAYTDPIAAAFGLDAFGYTFVGDGVTPVVLLEGAMGTESTTASLFGMATWNVSDTFRLTGGVRWADVSTDYRREDSPCTTLDEDIMPQSLVDLIPDDLFCFNGRDLNQSRSSDNVMPELAAQWDIDEAIMLYAKVSKSAKAGGFAFSTNLGRDAAGNVIVEYDDETAVGYETGIKGSFGDWEFNAALYRTEFEDLQVNTFDPVTADAIVQNAAEVTTQGIELDGRWAANEYIMLSGALAYLDASFDSFEGAPCAVDGSTPPSSGPVGCDASGLSTHYAPKWSGYFAMDVVAPINPDLQFLGGLSIAYSDEFLTDSSLAVFLTQPSYSKIDARIGVAQSDGRWELMLIGNNLTDELILNNGQVFVANAGYLKAPRRVTLKGTYRFGR
jgi:iron complex outermembrane receptor protein